MSSIIDFHTHILPGIDDGSSSIEVTVSMLELEKEHGIEQVVLTPHFYASRDGLDRFLERRSNAVRQLKTILMERQDLPRVQIGAEVEFFEGMSDCEQLPQLAISGTNCILVEMPMRRWTDEMLQELQGIYQNHRLIPIIAHIDRYIGKFKKFIRPEALLELPVMIQANAEFFIQNSSRRKALKMLSEGQIHLLGSDSHNLETRRPNLDEALLIIRENLGEGEIEQISQHGNSLFAANAAQNI